MGLHPDSYAKAANKKTIYASKAPPELQIHASATLVKHGDPYGMSKDVRLDTTYECCQFVVPIESKFVGNLSSFHIRKSMDVLTEKIIESCRRHNLLKSGE